MSHPYRLILTTALLLGLFACSSKVSLSDSVAIRSVHRRDIGKYEILIKEKTYSTGTALSVQSQRLYVFNQYLPFVFKSVLMTDENFHLYEVNLSGRNYYLFEIQAEPLTLLYPQPFLPKKKISENLKIIQQHLKENLLIQLN